MVKIVARGVFIFFVFENASLQMFGITMWYVLQSVSMVHKRFEFLMLRKREELD